MFKYINEHQSEYNTILQQLKYHGEGNQYYIPYKEHCLAKQIQIYIKRFGFCCLMIMVVNQQGEIIFTLFGLFAESEVKTKLERFGKRKEPMVMV
jgi:hypothetical protein